MFQAKFGTEETDLGLFYTTAETVADKITLKAKNLTEKYGLSIRVEFFTYILFK